MKPVKASGWFNVKISKDERDALLKTGVVPVNDIFYPVWNASEKILLLFGSYGSGKSDFAAARYLHKALTMPYFRLYFGRRVEKDVRESCHSKLVSVIKRHGMESQFKYSEEPTGSMVITCLKNGNKMMPFGTADAAGMKSVDDPTDIWMEEADQFTDTDMQILLSRLRTPAAPHQMMLTFNTATVLPGHWILKYFFPEQVHPADMVDLNEDLLNALRRMPVKKVFCNYTDNYFIDKEEYLLTLQFTSGGDEAYFNAIARGDWGVSSAGLLFPLNKLKLYKHDDSLVTRADYRYFAGDPSDKGGDFFAGQTSFLLNASGNKNMICIPEMIFNAQGTIVNEPRCIETIMRNRCDAAGIEGVFGWRETHERIRDTLYELDFENEVRCLNPRTNKKVRIRARKNFILKNVYFRDDYQRFPEYAAFIKNLTTYHDEAEAKNKNDDAPDVSEMTGSHYESLFPELWRLEMDTEMERLKEAYNKAREQQELAKKLRGEQKI